MELTSAVSILKKEIHKEKQEYILQNSKSVSITQNGETEITPATGNDAMKKVVVTTAVPVPALETNKTAIIDVSQYSEAVEITPSSQKDAMEKTTVTLTNIPVAGATLYAWKDESDNVAYTKSATPEAEDDCFLSAVTGLSSDTIKEVDEGSITVTISEEDVEFTRYSDGDIEL